MSKNDLSIVKAPAILVVDDEEDIGRFLQSALQREGFDCLTVTNAEDALGIMKQNHFDVVVTDIKMPGMDGLNLCRQIKSAYDTDVMVMTGFSLDFTYEQIISMGASDFLIKPVTNSELAARIKRILSERRFRAERLEALAELKTQLEKFQRAMEGIVQAMSVAVEMRDPYTAGHQQRVAELAGAIATGMGLDHETVYGLEMASRIHDLGKITVPAEILSKPGRLSGLEYELIKNHVKAGYDILKKIEFPWPIADVILQHHERLDGSGYPNGLSGDAILLEARIMAVADVFETIASHRPYRPSLGVRKAMDELAAGQGLRYDPEVVKVCLELVGNKGFSFSRSWEKPEDRASASTPLEPAQGLDIQGR